MNAAAKELPVSYDLSKPQEDREPYVGSVLFFKHVIFTVTLLLILIPTTLSIYLFAQVRSLSRQLDAAGSQLAAMQEQLPSTTPEGGEPTPAEPDPPAAEVPAYTELYPELYADDSLRGTVDVDNSGTAGDTTGTTGGTGGAEDTGIDEGTVSVDDLPDSADSQTGAQDSAAVPQQSAGLTWLWVLLGVIAVAAIIGIVVTRKKKH